MRGMGNPQGLQWDFGAAKICSFPTFVWLALRGPPPLCFLICSVQSAGLWVAMADVPRLGSGA